MISDDDDDDDDDDEDDEDDNVYVFLCLNMCNVRTMMLVTTMMVMIYNE